VKYAYAKLVLVIILALITILSGCSGDNTSGEPSVMTGDTVKVHYTGRLTDGTEFDSSVGGTPLEFTVGSGSVISGFDQAVIGMQVGQSKTVTIPAEDAYGLLEYEVDREQIPQDLELEVGQQVQYYTAVCTITDISDTTVTLRNDHSLAGEDLIFDIELVEIL
jgi:FKBP-type peptidyl-prolyl cis-trans isomerase 2